MDNEQIAPEHSEWDHLATTVLLTSGRIGTLRIKQRVDEGRPTDKVEIVQLLRDILNSSKELTKQAEKMLADLDAPESTPPAAESED